MARGETEHSSPGGAPSSAPTTGRGLGGRAPSFATLERNWRRVASTHTLQVRGGLQQRRQLSSVDVQSEAVRGLSRKTFSVPIIPSTAQTECRTC